MVKMLHLVILLLAAISMPAVARKTEGQHPPAPEFALKDLEGGTVALSDYRGKVVLLNFWATWCAPCRAEMPDLVKWQKQYQSSGLRVIGITFPPYGRKSVQQAARQLEVNYPILFGTREITDKYRVDGVLPTSFVIDKEGKIRARIPGILRHEEFEQKVMPLLK
jgi:peroxiredoxin